MSLLIGGIISGIIGLISLVLWWGDFMTIVKGAVPICLLLSGALAVYVGIDEIQEKMTEEKLSQEEKLEMVRQEAEKAKAEAEKYKEELSKLKKN